MKFINFLLLLTQEPMGEAGAVRCTEIPNSDFTDGGPLPGDAGKAD